MFWIALIAVAVYLVGAPVAAGWARTGTFDSPSGLAGILWPLWVPLYLASYPVSWLYEFGASLKK